MAESEVLSPRQFSRTAKSGDPATTQARAKFTLTESKTMRNSGGHLPSPQDRHVHHRRAGKRSRRAH